jgi:2-oxoglutarate ferredoxin oxidoreductase subunit gamma
MRKELRIAGFGGQGVITIGLLLAKAVGQYGDSDVVQTQSYGPEARGGACKTEIVISDTTIDYIKVLNLDMLVAMSQPALDTYVKDLPAEGVLLVDDTLVETVPEGYASVYRIPATGLAESEIGLRVVANVVMFGAIAKVTGLATPEQCKQALEDSFPAKVIKKNYAAFDLGYNFDFASRGAAK